MTECPRCRTPNPPPAKFCLECAAPMATRCARCGTPPPAALALAEPRGMRPLVAPCHLGVGKLYRRSGKREQAREHLTAATTMYGEMDMRFWLEQAEAVDS